jgi:hypothetical protein
VKSISVSTLCVTAFAACKSIRDSGGILFSAQRLASAIVGEQNPNH